MQDSSVNLIDNIECKYKDWKSYSKVALDAEKHELF